MDSIIKISKEGNEIILRVGVDYLAYAISIGRTEVTIHNREAFAEAFVKELGSYQSQNSKETGLTALEEFFDNIGEQVIESGLPDSVLTINDNL